MHTRCYSLTGIMLLLLTAGCTKEFNIELDKTQPLFVIEGRISNLTGPYYVRITKSTNSLGLGGGPYNDSAEAVTGALVTISDDSGITDTLIPANSYNRYRYFYFYKNGKVDSIKERLPPYYSDKYRGDRGYYETTKITGRPGHTYHLLVRTGNEEFHASAYMPNAPEIDSAALKEATINAKGDKGLLPFVWFKEPQNEKNYYLLMYNPITDYPYDNSFNRFIPSGVYPFYVVDDALLPPYINGMAVQMMVNGHDPYSNNYPYIIYNDPVQVRLSSLTKEAYNFFKALGRQLEDDGNAYRPAPSSPPGNISGNALGLFWATQISHKLILR
ncbi:DUF4249 domain-containing protein [Niastella caeni]|uniref:DUF4249 domain-containing protein n=1 Tax=Niastella caeni TaxID=2569763 RepID=A0A4V4H1F3_9BACT|nr:DUF4249 domain-containing protein [Niastella caeni]THU40246.1 DUF4249 domain-containing protein [Niastella caeni]